MLCASDQLGRDMLVRPATEVEGGNCDTCAESAQHRRWLRTLHDDYNERLSRASLTSSNGSEACTFESDRELSDDDDKGALCRFSFSDARPSGWSEANSPASDRMGALGSVCACAPDGETSQGAHCDALARGRSVSAVSMVEEQWLCYRPPMLRRQHGDLWRLAARGVGFGVRSPCLPE